jgi:hypothetical protein
MKWDYRKLVEETLWKIALMGRGHIEICRSSVRYANVPM